jgi:hypothetical protein
VAAGAPAGASAEVQQRSILHCMPAVEAFVTAEKASHAGIGQLCSAVLPAEWLRCFLQAAVLQEVCLLSCNVSNSKQIYCRSP